MDGVLRVMHDVIIYKPSKTAMQSGRAKTKQWILSSMPAKQKYVDPLMHWTGAIAEPGITKLSFATLEEAIAFAVARKWTYQVLTPHTAEPRPKSYASNFLSPKF